MDDEQKRLLMVAHISKQMQGFEPRPRNFGMGILARLFDNLKDERLLEILPEGMVRHIFAKDDYVAQGRFDAWCYQLFYLTHQCLIDEQGCLRRDLICAIGSTKYREIQEYSLAYLHDFHAPEKTVLNALIFGCSAYFFHREQNSATSEAIQRLAKDNDVYNINTLHTLRKLSLANQLKLDSSNPEHLAFWAARTKTKWSLGGKSVLLGQERYRLPTHVKAMMELFRHHVGTYEDFKDELNAIRAAALANKPRWPADNRDIVTKCLYESRDLEQVDVQTLADGEREEQDVNASIGGDNMEGGEVLVLDDSNGDQKDTALTKDFNRLSIV